MGRENKELNLHVGTPRAKVTWGLDSFIPGFADGQLIRVPNSQSLTQTLQQNSSLPQQEVMEVFPAEVLERVELLPLAVKLHPLHGKRQTDQMAAEQPEQEAFKSVFPLQQAANELRLHQQTSHNRLLPHDWTIGSRPFTSFRHSEEGLGIPPEILNSTDFLSFIVSAAHSMAERFK